MQGIIGFFATVLTSISIFVGTLFFQAPQANIVPHTSPVVSATTSISNTTTDIETAATAQPADQKPKNVAPENRPAQKKNGAKNAAPSKSFPVGSAPWEVAPSNKSADVPAQEIPNNTVNCNGKAWLPCEQGSFYCPASGDAQCLTGPSQSDIDAQNQANAVAKMRAEAQATLDQSNTQAQAEARQALSDCRTAQGSYLATFNPSPKVAAIQSQLDDIIAKQQAAAASEQQQEAAVTGQPIPQGLITGQAASLQRQLAALEGQLAAEAVPLNNQLALLQQQQQAQQAQAKARVEIYCGTPQSGSGACSYHGGVNCSTGPDIDGSVVCNDGWRDSTVSYYSVVECR
jgi:hypothetical protein